MPLTIDSLRHIENAGFILLRISEQFSIGKKGERYTKNRVTHDCSFSGPSGLSLYNRVLKDTRQPYFYGFYLLRILHMVAAIHIKWPSKHILRGKPDLGTAYRRVHANTHIAATCIAIVGKLPFFTTLKRRIYHHQ